MSKTYKGYELLKAIEDEDIKDGTKIEIIGRFTGNLRGSYFIYKRGITGPTIIYEPNRKEYFDKLSIPDLVYYKFKILEKEQDIDIQAIEEIPIKILNTEDLSEHIVDLNNLSSKLLQAVKQLDRKIREER